MTLRQLIEFGAVLGQAVSFEARLGQRAPSLIRALRKLVASVSADEGTLGGKLSTRFSTWLSSATSTASARSGSSRTNSICFSRELDFAVSTTAAARVRPDSCVNASSRAA